MFKVLFDIIIDLLATIIQIVVFPLNLAISTALPSFSSQLTSVTLAIGDIMTALSWPLSILPPSTIAILLFIVGCEIAKHTIYISTHTLIKVWVLVQKLKFW